MSFIAWIVVGVIAGIVAKLIVPGKDKLGCLLTTLLGIAGASLGGWIGTRMGWGNLNGVDLRSIGLAILGAVLILFIVKIIFRKG